MYVWRTRHPAAWLHGATAMRAMVIVNPAAGRRTAGRVAPREVLPTLTSAGFVCDVHEMRADGPGAAELASRAAAERYDACVVAGGDGTVAAAGRALIGTATVLGILPFGSFMNIAHGLGIPLDPHEAAAVIARRVARGLDVGEANGHLFFEAAGVGLDAELFGAARNAERRSWRHALRRVRRWATAGTHLIHVTVDGTTYEHRAMQVLVLNSPYYAWAVHLLPTASLTDGMLDVAVFPRMGRVALLRSFVSVWRMRGRGVIPLHYRGRKIRIESAAHLAVHADGEAAGRLPIDIRCRPSALSVYVPS